MIPKNVLLASWEFENHMAGQSSGTGGLPVLFQIGLSGLPQMLPIRGLAQGTLGGSAAPGLTCRRSGLRPQLTI